MSVFQLQFELFIKYSCLVLCTELEGLVHNSITESTHESFDEQTLLCLMQESMSQQRNILVDPKLVTALVGIQRSATGQIYYTHSLERSLHFTISSNRFNQFTSKGYDENVRTPYLHIPNSVNYTNEHIKLSVINYDTEENKNPII